MHCKPPTTNLSISYKPLGSSSIGSMGSTTKPSPNLACRLTAIFNLFAAAGVRNESLVPKEVYLSVLCTGS